MAAATLVAIGIGTWALLPDGDGGPGGDGSTNDASYGPADTGGDSGPGGSAGSESGGRTAGPAPGTRGVGAWRPEKPPQKVVKDPDTLELERLLDAFAEGGR